MAPSSPFNQEGFERAFHTVKSSGYRPVAGLHAFRRNGYLAGSDLERVEDLVQALRDPSIAAVVCIRGGFGSSRLLDWLPFSTFTGCPKILLGYSDITFLHAAFSRRLDWVTFHGPNFMDASSDRTNRTESLFHVLEGTRPVRWNLEPHQILRHGRAEGKILGGNLTCFAHLIGTPYLPETSGTLLLLEDRGEALYRIDRTLVQLKQVGVLQRIAGLILGSFLDCGPSDAVWDLVLEHTHSCTFPIVCAMPFGHGSANEVLPLGLPFSLDTATGVLEGLESPFEDSGQADRGTGVKTPLPPMGPVAGPSPGAPENCGPTLEKLFEEALESRVFSGATLLVANVDGILWRGVWGASCHGGAPIDSETLFDLASLTKPLAVVPLLMRAVSTGVMDLEDPMSRFFPTALLDAGHRTITLRQLLNHCSGMPAYRPFYRELIQEPPETREMRLLDSVFNSPLDSRPGSACQYSDLGFMVLAHILVSVHGRSLHDLARELFTLIRASGGESPDPPIECGSNCSAGGQTPSPSTQFALPWIGYMPMRVPRDPVAQPTRLHPPDFSFASTEHCPWRQRLLRGEVHDENAYCLNGVAGHAGLFGTAVGVYGVLSFLWKVHRGLFEDGSWSRDVVQHFWSRQDLVPGATWALGYDTPSAACSSAGSHFSPRSVGHLGFTGTSFWIDLDRELLVILLTNRVHPSRTNEKIKVFRPALHDLVMEIFGD